MENIMKNGLFDRKLAGAAPGGEGERARIRFLRLIKLYFKTGLFERKM